MSATPLPAPAPCPELAALLGRVRPGAPLSLDDRTLVPLVLQRRRGDDVLDVDLLEEGIAAGRTSIFPAGFDRVQVVHFGPRCLLIVDGEPVLGSPRGGVFAESVIVPPGARIDARVSPYEGGARAPRLQPLPTQIGVAVVRGDAVIALHAYGAPGLFVRGWRKIARSLAVDPLPGSATSRDAVAVVERALRALGGLPLVRRPSLGIGDSLHASVAGWVAGAVVHQRRLYHAAATGGVQA